MDIDITPLVLPIDQRTTLTVSGLSPGAQYKVQVRARRRTGLTLERELCADRGGRLRIEATYAVRGEHTVDLWAHSEGAEPEGGTSPPTQERLARLSTYVAPPGLFSRRPLRCDFHIHTTYSDSRSSPTEMIVRGRELGLDVAVITDHNHYPSSVEAVAACRQLGLALITMPGEEVSAPTWHILSINADVGIYQLMLRAHGLDGGDRAARDAALSGHDALRWAIDAVQGCGGRAYLAHPYWAIDRGYHLPTDLYDEILDEGILDGLELLGEVRPENNIRSVARYLDLRAAGSDLPVLGNSDTHGSTHTYGLYWTLVLAEVPQQGSPLAPAQVLDAIADGWSVACTIVPGVYGDGVLDLTERIIRSRRSSALQAYGAFELVDYAYFLEGHFFPLHDALCAKEAALAYRASHGERLPEGTMAACRAEMEALYARCWGRGEV